MTSELPRITVCRMLVLTLVSVCFAGSAIAAPSSLRVGGSLGFGLTTSRQEGLYKWDFSAQQRTVDLLRLKLEASPVQGLSGFLRVDAPSTGPKDPPSLELGEASIQYARHWNKRDRVSLRAFAQQPQNLWLDQTLGAPIDPQQVGDAVQGARADVRWKVLFGTLLAADPATNPVTKEPRNDPFALLRMGVDFHDNVRVGATWMRETPHTIASIPAASPNPVVSSVVHWGSVDLTWQLRGVFLLVDYASSSPTSDAELDVVATAPQRPYSGLLEHWPETGALRAELRAVSLGSAAWGWIGFAPSLQVVGSRHVQRNRIRSAQWGTPRRGFQSWHLEAWYQAAGWPLWVRQVVDRNEAFVDAARRLDTYRTELEATLSPRLRSRAQWVARRVDEPLGKSVYRDLLLDGWIEEVGRRLRVQFGWIDIDRLTERQALAMEFSTPILGRWNAVARTGMTREMARLRPNFFAELQYWHVPQFEFAVSYGSDVFGDAADPVLDPDQIAAGDNRNVVRIHFRGWF